MSTNKAFQLFPFLVWGWFLYSSIGFSQTTDSIVPAKKYEPQWKLNSFGFSLRLMEHNYLTDYTIEDARKNFYSHSQPDFTDSIGLFSKAIWYNHQPLGVTFNTSWKSSKQNEMRLSFFIYEFDFNASYSHGWKVNKDTTGNLYASFKEVYSLIGFNLQRMKYTTPFLKNHVRIYAGIGVEIASDFNRGFGLMHLVYQEYYSDSVRAAVAGNRNLHAGLNYNVVDGYSMGTKMRLYGAINTLIGLEFILKNRIKTNRERFSLFAEYGLGLDGEVLIGGSSLARWSHQVRFGFRYFLK